MIHRPLKKFTALLLLTAVIVAQCGCTAQTAPEQPATQTSFGEDWLLNTYCYIQTYDAGQEDLIRDAFSVARDYENLLSRTIEASDIGHFNASTGGCDVTEETAQLVQDCRDAWEMSGGKLDATMGAVTQLWDFSAADPKVPDAAAVAEALTHVGAWDKIWIEPIDGGPADVWQILKDDAGIALDLGAVAKGYIADRVALYLWGSGVNKAVINFGGNVVFLGAKEDGSPWACGIEDPAAGGGEELIQDRDIVGLVNCRAANDFQVSVVTSGTYERCFTVDGTTYHHVLDPATGYPVETDLLSATILGESSEMCDILSTTCLLLGSEKGLELIQSQEGYEAVFILTDGSIVKTDGADFKEQ